MGTGQIVRHELKFLVPEDRVQDLKRDLQHFLVHDEHAARARDHRYTVRSLYFDTPNIRFYYDKLFGHNCRSKVRIRRYEIPGTEPSDWFFEIKSKYHNACVKPRRLAFSDALLRAHLRDHGTFRLNELVERISPGQAVSQQPTLWALPLEPKVLVAYDREALVDARRGRFRVTFDFNIQAAFTGNPYEPLGPVDTVPLPVVMEWKFERSIPFWLEAVRRKYHLHMEPVTKYGQGVEAAFPLLGTPRSRAFSDEGVAPSALGLLKHFVMSF